MPLRPNPDGIGSVLAQSRPDAMRRVPPLSGRLPAKSRRPESDVPIAAPKTFATLMQGKGTLKGAQTQLRHKDILTSLNICAQPTPESVKQSVEALVLKALDEFGRESDVAIQ